MRKGLVLLRRYGRACGIITTSAGGVERLAYLMLALAFKSASVAEKYLLISPFIRGYNSPAVKIVIATSGRSLTTLQANAQSGLACPASGAIVRRRLRRVITVHLPHAGTQRRRRWPEIAVCDSML